jgi:hypothetical protein
MLLPTSASATSATRATTHVHGQDSKKSGQQGQQPCHHGTVALVDGNQQQFQRTMVEQTFFQTPQCIVFARENQVFEKKGY